MGEERKVYKVLVGKPEGKRPLGRPRRRWEDGIRMDLRETGLGGGGVDWISTVSGQGPVAGCCECGDEPSGSCATELVCVLSLLDLFLLLSLFMEPVPALLMKLKLWDIVINVIISLFVQQFCLLMILCQRTYLNPSIVELFFVVDTK
jgi:hypothetical protein